MRERARTRRRGLMKGGEGGFESWDGREVWEADALESGDDAVD